MSSTTTVTPTSMVQAPSSPSQADPASSLRAAALRTLRRRKLLSTDTISARPLKSHIVTEKSVQLDYGQDEMASSPPEAQTVDASSVVPKSPDVDQGREEGEISDSDEPSPERMMSFPSLASPLPVAPPKASRKPSISSVEPHRTTVAKQTTPPKSSIPKIESPVVPRFMDRAFEVRSPMSPDGPRSLLSGYQLALLDDTIRQIDENHVRPGLAMDQQQYDTAKDIVLDLLGWGVPPEYLVDCGLSREIVFYVFSELNLRLPANLETAGLLPFPPIPEMLRVPLQPPALPGGGDASSDHRSARVISGADRNHRKDFSPSNSKTNFDAPVSSAAVTLLSPSSPSTSRRNGLTSKVVSHHMLTGADTSTLATPTTSPVNNLSTGSASASLHDMERQRRQELLARKAALASRKSKTSTSGDASQASTTSSQLVLQQQPTRTNSVVSTQPITIPTAPSAPSSTASSYAEPSNVDTALSSGMDHEIDVTMTPVLNDALVDDFLKSITPAAPTESRQIPVESIVPEASSGSCHASPDEMDVDIPGLSGIVHPRPSAVSDSGCLSFQPPSALGSPYARNGTNSSTLSLAQEKESSPQSDLVSIPVTQESAQPRPLRRNDSESTSTDSIMGDMNQLSGPPLQRRGLKRPVAADFVDFSESNGAQTDIIAASLPPRNGTNGLRRGGSFAGLSGMRRCVIDLSDSEGEGDEALPSNTGFSRESLHERDTRRNLDTRSRARGSRFSPAGWSTPPVHGGASSANGTSNLGFMSPGALEEKEKEIQRMREMIAQREQNRFKKLALSRFTPTIRESSPSSTGSSGESPVAVPVADFKDAESKEHTSSNHFVTANVLQGNDPNIPPTSQYDSISPPVSLDTPANDSVAEQGTLTIDQAAGEGENDKAVSRSNPPQPGQDIRSDNNLTSLLSQVILYFLDVLEKNSSEGWLIHQEQEMEVLPEDLLEPVGSHSMIVDNAAPANMPPTYGSIFKSYPLLLSTSTSFASGSSSSSSHTSRPSSPFEADLQYLPSSTHRVDSSPLLTVTHNSSSTSVPPLPDLKILRLVTLSKSVNPNQQICRYEIPGGGVCRDAGCQDIHLTRLGLQETGENAGAVVEPSDQDTARYLFEQLPTTWLRAHGIHSAARILQAIREVRPSSSTRLEDRIAQAIADLSASGAR